MDVKSTFLNGVLEDEVYLEQPPSHVKKGQKKKVYKLYNALYGLKQAPRAWYTCVASYFPLHSFNRCPNELALYVKNNANDDMLFTSPYVDDLIFTENNSDMVDDFKHAMITKI